MRPPVKPPVWQRIRSTRCPVSAGQAIDTGEVLAGKLAALVGIEGLRGTIGLDRLLQRIDAEAGIGRIGYVPRQHLAPVHDCDQIHRAARHRDIRSIRCPDLIRVIDDQSPQQVVGPEISVFYRATAPKAL